MFCEENSAARRKYATSKHAHEGWEREHAVFYHHDQQKIQINQANMFPQTSCNKHAVCVCGRSPNSCPDALLVFNKFIKLVKPIFTKTKTHISEQRALLERAFIVLRFRPQIPESEDRTLCLHEDLYIHVGYINFSTWIHSVMQLVKVTDCNKHGYLQLAPLCTEDVACPHHGISTFVQFVAKTFDFRLHYSAKLFQLVCDDNDLLEEDYMLGSCIEVKDFERIGEFSIWLGHAQERRDAAKLRLKDATKTGRKRKCPETKTIGEGQPKHVRTAVRSRPLLSMIGSINNADENDAIAHALQFASPETDSDLDSGPPGNESAQLESELEIESEEEEEESNFDEDELVEDRVGLGDTEEDPYVKDEDSDSDACIEAILAKASSPAPSPSPSRPSHSPGPSHTPGVGSADSTVEKKDGMKKDSKNKSSSSESSSSGSKSDSDSSSSKGTAEPVERRVAMFDSHEIHYNVNGKYFRAHCSVHEGCRRQRTIRESTFSFHNQGQGRPLGLLAAWLQSATDYPDKASHGKARVSALGERKTAREAFKKCANVQVFFDFERTKRDDEDSEPDNIV